jgi:small subunit ribosomal protein S20
MPILKSALKKLKQSRVRADKNHGMKHGVKELMDTFKRKVTLQNFSKAVSAIDKAAKTGVIHKNKANRLKSRLAKRLPKMETKSSKSPKKTSKKD